MPALGQSRSVMPAGLLLDLDFVGALAAELGAGALGHVFPLVGAVVDLVLAGAGMRARQVGAIVLAGLGDAVALFLGLGALVGSLGARQQPEGEDGSESGRGDQTLVHGNILLWSKVAVRLPLRWAGRRASVVAAAASFQPGQATLA